MADKKSAREILEELINSFGIDAIQTKEEAVTQALLELQALLPKEKGKEYPKEKTAWGYTDIDWGYNQALADCREALGKEQIK